MKMLHTSTCNHCVQTHIRHFFLLARQVSDFVCVHLLVSHLEEKPHPHFLTSCFMCFVFLIFYVHFLT